MNNQDQVARCGHCPVERGRPCEGLHARRLCELADPAHPDYSPAYRALLVRLAQDAGREADLDPDGGWDRRRPVRGPAETIALLGRMHECPDRTPRADCGCAGLARCARGRGRQGLVNHHDCLDCLAPAPSE
jgi:hypothetical protein